MALPIFAYYARFVMPERIRSSLSRLLLSAPVIVIYPLLNVAMRSGLAVLIHWLSTALVAFGLSMLIGALLGIAPGMVIGTIVGLVRTLEPARSQNTEKERHVYRNGLVIPLFATALLGTLYLLLDFNVVRWLR